MKHAQAVALAEMFEDFRSSRLRELMAESNLKNWNGILLDHLEPHIERVSILDGQYEIAIHKVTPSSGLPVTYLPFQHHPCIMHVLHGGYEMGLGFGTPFGPPPPLSLVLELHAKNSYTILDGNVWYWGRSLYATPSYVLMFFVHTDIRMFACTVQEGSPLPQSTKCNILRMASAQLANSFR